MSDATPAFDFSQFVPGFDFLKNLAAGAAAPGPGAGSVPGLPSLSSWVAPTLSVEEVDKRIQELKTVQYWLEQNGHALKATIQALEVQKMTLSTLRGMNVRMEDLANAFTRHAQTATAAVMPASAPAPAASSAPAMSPAPSAAPAPAPATPMASFFGRMTGASAAEPVSDDDGDGDAASAESAGDGAQPVDAPDAPDMAGSKAGVVDPLQWWGALTQQFQQIAESAMKDAAQIQMPQMPQMPDLSGAADKPAKTARSRRSTTATGSTQRAPAGAARTRVASAPAARSAGTARDTPTAGRKTDGARSTRAAAKTAPRKSAAAPASARRSRG